MKKSGKTLLTATLLTTAVNMVSCDSDYQNVYGPPPDIKSEMSESSSYDPYDEPLQPEYGVYEYYKDVNQTTEEITTAEIRKYNPEDEEPAVVYGPLSCFGIKEKIFY